MPDSSDQPAKPVKDVIAEDGRYSSEAYAFLHSGLAKAVKDRNVPGDAPPAAKHVSGQDLCLALRDLAVEQWGQLAQTVLAKWNIHETIDFGHMVYLLIEAGYMKKTADDSLDDFRDVYDFTEAFGSDDDFEMKE